MTEPRWPAQPQEGPTAAGAVSTASSLPAHLPGRSAKPPCVCPGALQARLRDANPKTPVLRGPQDMAQPSHLPRGSRPPGLQGQPRCWPSAGRPGGGGQSLASGLPSLKWGQKSLLCPRLRRPDPGTGDGGLASPLQPQAPSDCDRPATTRSLQGRHLTRGEPRPKDASDHPGGSLPRGPRPDGSRSGDRPPRPGPSPWPHVAEPSEAKRVRGTEATRSRG